LPHSCAHARQAADSPRRLDESTLPYSVLRAGAVAGIDNRRKEHYLAAEEFVTVLSVPEDQFEALPKWKRNELKKKAGIY
jgi:hypothetical protein